MAIEYKVTYRRVAWKPNTWPKRKLYRSWAGAVAYAKKLEAHQDKYGPIEITIEQRECGPWRPTVWSIDPSTFYDTEGEE